ncbi:probable polygalacturonase At3g15720 [Vigna radiata var. radiata]|uniref:Probable polygalacturonase At3g15720 n=1 Tax=Vigna radiata var. radiata TaxID=3916 RepID=A0A1S3VBD1_VIGRR|nr:probable polygalacturonase At3g15720 [Vigna radiata var. radiata]
MARWIQIFNVNGLTIDADGGIIDGNGGRNAEHAEGQHPEAHIAVNGCDGALVSHINIHSPPKSPNTDGFDIANSKNIVIEDSTLATGDDCIAINGGSSYINATRLFCIGGHGISMIHNCREDGKCGQSGKDEDMNSESEGPFRRILNNSSTCVIKARKARITMLQLANEFVIAISEKECTTVTSEVNPQSAWSGQEDVVANQQVY